MKSLPSTQTCITLLALIGLIGLGAGMLFVSIPAANSTALTFILGALAGAITAHEAGKTPSNPQS